MRSTLCGKPTGGFASLKEIDEYIEVTSTIHDISGPRSIMTKHDLNWLRPYIPTGIRPFVRSTRRALGKLYYVPIDLWSKVRGRDELTPPPSLIFVGDGDFKTSGEEFAGYFVRLAGLRPADTVLDVGCGIGRMAVPLTKILSAQGRYVGFDIVERGIRWASEAMTPRFPNFTFILSDIYNKGYNPKGKVSAREYRFPAEDSSIDFVFATSVLTHLLREDTEHYLAETSRVLRPGGCCLITFFLMNEESARCMKSGRSILNFQFPLGEGALTIDKVIPENAVAYSEEDVRSTFARLNLEISEPIHYGSWCGREKFLSKQDVVIARKKKDS
jgi:SAM-dependent methyltransferase